MGTLAIGVETVSNYLERIETLCNIWDVTANDQEALWFRGMRSKIHSLEPRLLREVKFYCPEHPRCKSTADCKGKCVKKIQRAEECLMTLFKNRGRIEIAQAESIQIRRLESRAADLHYLFRIQHYGGDTRLLDWTANALNALYFALRRDHKVHVEDYDPSVWVLSPYNLLNQQREMPDLKDKLDISVHLDSIPTADDKLTHVFLERHIINLIQKAKDKDPGSPPLEIIKYPIPLMPALDEERIRSQQGRFTLHLKVPGWHPPEGIDKILVQIRINHDSRDNILCELNRMGINEFYLFPDLEGLARHCRDVQLIWGPLSPD